MANPLFNALNGGNRPGNGARNMLQQFHQFRQRMQGVNPQEEVQKLLQSGRISQAQLDISTHTPLAGRDVRLQYT